MPESYTPHFDYVTERHAEHDADHRWEASCWALNLRAFGRSEIEAERALGEKIQERIEAVLAAPEEEK